MVRGGSTDTDGDTLTDSEEVDWNCIDVIMNGKEYTSEDGIVIALPTLGEILDSKLFPDIESFKRLQMSSRYNKKIREINILPIKSDPTSVDGDNDGLLDVEEIDIHFSDPLKLNKWFEYDRNLAIEYSAKWAYEINEDFYSYKSDCANFMSQCLYAGGFVMNDDWHSIKGEEKTFLETKVIDFPFILFSKDRYKYFYNWDVTDSWSGVDEFINYINSTDYVVEVVTIDRNSDINEIIKKYNIQIGNPMFFDDNGDGDSNHATIISNIESDVISYAAHTNSRDEEDVLNYLNKNKQCKAYIYILKEGKYVYDK